MGRHYREYNPDQALLLPPTLQEWLPPGHLAYFISDTVEQLDITELHGKYERSGEGTLPYDPKMMLKVLVYAYASGVFSSRAIERKLYEDVAFRVLGAGNFPVYRTIARFRQENIGFFGLFFTQVVKIASEAGLVKLGTVAIDGTKVKANASKHKAMSYGRMKEDEARLKEEIKNLVKQAADADQREDVLYGRDKRGDEIPAELERRESRLAVIRAARKRLEERHKQEQEKRDDGGSSGAGTSAGKPDDKKQENFTDPDSRIMKTSGGFEQCYNAQIAVDKEAQIIVAADVTQATNDKKQLIPMVKTIKKECGVLPNEVLLDAGYISEPNLLKLEKLEINGFVSVGREGKKTPEVSEALLATQRMASKLKGKRGSTTYRMRKWIVEPEIGWIKSVLGFRSFSLRGVRNVIYEWKLVCLSLNLRRMNTRMVWT